jgi:hypothetical protein
VRSLQIAAISVAVVAALLYAVTDSEVAAGAALVMGLTILLLLRINADLGRVFDRRGKG